MISENKTINKIAAPHLESVESIRALAALMIIIFHMVLLPKIEIPDYLNFIKTHFGQGVPLFYALSGFVLSYGYLTRLNNKDEIIHFFVRRFFRIAPLFYTMLIIWIVIGMIKWGRIPSYNDISLNVLLLFGVVPGKHESIVWAGWSIGVEVLFYLLFPVIVVLVRNIRSGIFILSVTILVSSANHNAISAIDIGSFKYMNILNHLPTFLSGMIAFLIWRKFKFTHNRIWGGVLFVFTIGLVFILINIPLTHKWLRFYMWGFLYVSLILSLCLWPCRLMVNRYVCAMGRVSFSLYLWHPLVILLLTDIYASIGNKFGSGFINFIICFFITMFCVGFMAFFSYRIIELPGMKYGKNIVFSAK